MVGSDDISETLNTLRFEESRDRLKSRVSDSIQRRVSPVNIRGWSDSSARHMLRIVQCFIGRVT